MRKLFGGILLVFGGLAALGFLVGEENADRGAVIFCIILLVIGGVLFFKRTPSKAEKELGFEQKNCSISSVQHMAGLPIAEGVSCALSVKKGFLDVEGGGVSYKLDLSKVTDAEVKTDVEIGQAYVSSIGGAVGGALLFGPLGAMVGGRAKKKETKSVEHYIIITYLSDEKIEFLSFHADIGEKARNFVDVIRSKKSGVSETVEL